MWKTLNKKIGTLCIRRVVFQRRCIWRSLRKTLDEQTAFFTPGVFLWRTGSRRSLWQRHEENPHYLHLENLSKTQSCFSLLYITKHGSRNFEDRNQERILKETLGPDTPSCGFNPNPSRLALAEDTTWGCQQGGRGFIEVCTEAVEQREYSHQAKHTQLRIQISS